jgi:hypothetical protein
MDSLKNPEQPTCTSGSLSGSSKSVKAKLGENMDLKSGNTSIAKTGKQIVLGDFTLARIFCKQEEKILFFGSISGCTCLIFGENKKNSTTLNGNNLLNFDCKVSIDKNQNKGTTSIGR